MRMGLFMTTGIRRHRRAIAAVAVSAASHACLFVLLVAAPRPEPAQRFRVRVSQVKLLPRARFRSRATRPVSRQLLERLRAPAVRMHEPGLAAEGRRYTTVIVDPESGRLRQAWLLLPVYTRARTSSSTASAAVAPPLTTGPLGRLRRGWDTPFAMPLSGRLHTFPLGPRIENLQNLYYPIEGFSLPDPLHRFQRYPQRHLLRLAELEEYLLVDLRRIDIESTPVAVSYLLRGGFFITGRGQLAVLERALRDSCGDRIERILVGIGHPLFRAYFRVEKYQNRTVPCSNGGTRNCPSYGPLTALQLDGRMVAVGDVPPYVADCDCPSNQLYANVLAFALSQPSRLGRRYVASKSAAQSLDRKSVV